MAATSILTISETFYGSGLDNQYIKPFISCVNGYLTLQFIVCLYSFDGFSTFDAREGARECRHGVISVLKKLFNDEG